MHYCYFPFYLIYVCFEHLQYFLCFLNSFEENIYDKKFMQACINSIVFHLCLTDVLTMLMIYL